MDDDLIFNGIDGTTGEYLVRLTAKQAASCAQQEPLNESHVQTINGLIDSHAPTFGVVGTVSDASDLAKAGWGVIFATDANEGVREALMPLLELRRQQATGIKPGRYQEYTGARGYHAGETGRDFLKNRNVFDTGPVDPDQMPYYLLIVGDPRTIPYSFQYEIDVQYAVGRIYFETLYEYAQYAQSVVLAEKNNPRPRLATFFAAENEGDRPTQLSTRYLAEPLVRDAHEWRADLQVAHGPWDIVDVMRAQATKDRLSRLLCGEAPMLLFTASHGAGFQNADPLQLRHQGALVCQDWPGPNGPLQGPLEKCYLSADDVGEDARLLGMLAFHFACFGLGTPGQDDYPQLVNGQIKPSGPLGLSPSLPTAPYSFVARLPQRLLGHPKGGALAVVGHVERALGSSFFVQSDAELPLSPPTFRGALYQLMNGTRLGAAIEPFGERYAQLGADLAQDVKQIAVFGKLVQDIPLARKWMAAADARGYAIFGDPAVRLSVEADPPPDGEQTTIAAEVSGATFTAATPPPVEEPAPAAPPAAIAPRVRLEIDSATGRIMVTTGGASGSPDDVVSYGWPLGGHSPLAEMSTKLMTVLASVADRLGTALGDLVSDVNTLEIATYTAANLDDVEYDAQSQRFVSGSVQRRVLTYLRLDGDTVAVIPEPQGEVDRELLAFHSETVQRAAAQRAELIKSMFDAVGGLLGISKSGGG